MFVYIYIYICIYIHKYNFYPSLFNYCSVYKFLSWPLQISLPRLTGLLRLKNVI